MLVNPTSCVKIGLNCTGSTVDWWLTQESDVLNKVIIKSIQEGHDIKVVLEEYSKFLNNARKKYDVKNINVWGNGLLADNKWLESAYMAAKIDLPWAYYEGKDVRTLVDLGISMGINPKKTLVFKGQKHNAIDDCNHQIDYCTPIVQLAESVHELLKLKAEQEKKKEETSECAISGCKA